MIEGMSGFLLCYGPLLLVFVAFLAGAYLSDTDVRRTYLRNLDPSTDAERGELPEPVALAKPFTAKTPSGGRVTLQASSVIMSAAPAPAVVQAPAPQAKKEEAPAATAVVEEKPAPAPKAAEPNDLQRLEGIGPKMNKILNDAGIETFAQLADKSVDELKAILKAGGASAINDPTSWPEQAELARDGKWETLDAFQAGLTAGRK